MKKKLNIVLYLYFIILLLVPSFMILRYYNTLKNGESYFLKWKHAIPTILLEVDMLR